MNYLLIGLLLVFSYLLGSIPFGLIVGKLGKGIDIREHGSNNMGATNAVRVLGFKLGFLVFILDASKGAFVILLTKILNWTNVIDLVSIGNFNISIFYGFMAVIGNVFPIFANFRGGKAVACSLGAVLALIPIVGAIAVLVFIVVILLTGYVSLGSMIGAVTVVVLSLLDIGLQIWTKDGGFDYYLFQVIGLGLMITFLLIRHIPNIKRLLKGTENSFNIGLRKYLNNKKNAEEDKKDA